MSQPAPADFTDPTADWKCYPGDAKAMRLNPSGDPECMTRAGREKECYPACLFGRFAPPNTQGPALTCGERHQSLYGRTGYGDKNGWCDKYKETLTPARNAYMSKVEADRKAREAEEAKKRMEAEAELKRMAATREDLKTPWQCLPGMTAPMRMDKNGKYECYSENGKDCAWQQDLNACNTYAATLNTQQASLAAASNSPGAVVVQAGGSLVRRGGSGNKKGALNKKKGGQIPNAPLECTPENLADPNHWCYKSKAALTLPPPQAAVDMAARAATGTSTGLTRTQMENPLRFMPIPERCKAYENLVNTGTDAEKEQYRQWAAAECLPHYNSLVKEAATSQNEQLNQYATQIGTLRNQVRGCRSAFNLPASKGTIVSAWYGVETGSEKNAVDVTKVLQQMYDSGTSKITVSSGVFGDPAPGVSKYLFISYTPPEDQAVYKYKFPENKVFDLQFPDLQLGGGIRQRAGAELAKETKRKHGKAVAPPPASQLEGVPQSGGGSDYQYWHGVDVIGSDLRRSRHAGNVPRMQTECTIDPKCVGFNTKGMLKGYTLQKNFVPMKNPGPGDGLYVNLRKHNQAYGFGPGPQGMFTTIETGLDAGPADFAAYPPFSQPRVQRQRGGGVMEDFQNAFGKAKKVAAKSDPKLDTSYLDKQQEASSDVKQRCAYTESKVGYEPANLFDGAYSSYDDARLECDRNKDCEYIFEFVKDNDKPTYHLGKGPIRKTKLQSPPFKVKSIGCDTLVVDDTTDGLAGMALSQGSAPAIVTDKRYVIENHKDYPALMKKAAATCPNMKDYIPKRDIAEQYEKSIRLIQDLQKMNSTYKTDIASHPDYQFLMNKYASKDSNGNWVPCSNKAV